MVNLSAAILRWARAEPARPALLYRDQRLGYGDLAARLAATAGSLRARGIGEGDIVALLARQLQRDLGDVGLDDLIGVHCVSSFSNLPIASFMACHDAVSLTSKLRPSAFSA